MRQPIPLTDEMYEELVTLRENGMGLRPIGKHFGVSHQTIKNWLDFGRVVNKYSNVTGWAQGDRATLKRDIASGLYRLSHGEEVVIHHFDLAANSAWITCYRLPSAVVAGVPLNALKRVK